MAVKAVSSVMKKMFGTRNERLVKRYLKIVDQVSDREAGMRRLTDAELRAQTGLLRERIADGADAREMIPEIFAVAREAMDRAVGIRNIFNPEAGFDPSTLPPDARAAYDETKAEMDRTEARPPEGDLLGGTELIPSWQFVDIPNVIYDAVRELHPHSKPPYRARPFDVQIIGAVVLSEGCIAEMKTGEGKTIVAPLATYLAVLEDMQVHVVTVNDYLVQRDRDWVAPFFRALGLTVGAIHPMHMQPPPMKKLAYDCDVVYGTTAEFGFDYLRDNMKLSVNEQVQKKRNFAIVDEVDSTLIDEARTPLIISGPAHQENPRYDLARQLALHLVEMQKPWAEADQKVQSCLVEISGLEGDIRNARDKGAVPEMKSRLDAAKERLPQLEADRDQHVQFYEVELDKKKATVTHEGITEAQRKAGIGSFYQGSNIDLPHLLEQAIRAQSVYQRDRDYVVAPDEQGTPSIVIVDQNTGRKMVGRQWSDGLHQAIEAKESVPIKQETQTMATITIQNFFKLYDRLAGMTGTADTEATEFFEIYKLDVVVIPTNVPIARHDHNDVVYMSEKDKWEGIVDEVKRFHDVGRPVLVGTTSVEKSETLSEMLTRQHNVKHSVLNAKQHEREAELIQNAGSIGAVMIATNMAGRGTDIRLGQFTTAELIDHWKRRGIAPRDVNPDMDSEEVVRAVYRHLATKELGLRSSEVESMSDDEVRLKLLRKWAEDVCWWLSEGKIEGANEATLLEELDKSGAAALHRLRIWDNIEDMGGLHVVGTERHESRRIDNQLRGRSGRQGDNGSSRFFLSLEDDLMKMFAGPTVLNLLSKLGMKEGDSIEHPMLSKSVGKAQRKVEERNFLIRKNILEYDEVMDHQRHEFYGMRQKVLEGRGVKEIIFEHIDEAVNDAVYRYLDRKFVANCIAEWVRENLSVSIDADRIRRKGDREDLHTLIRIDSKEEAANLIDITLGEYLPEDGDAAGDWDKKSLVDWANASFSAHIRISEVQDATSEEIRKRLQAAADAAIDGADLGPLDQYLAPNYGEAELARWCNNKFNSDIKTEDFIDVEELDSAVDHIMKKARDTYNERERTYPVEFAIEMTAASMQNDPKSAVEQFCRWASARYELEWSPNALPSGQPTELRRILLEEADKWDDARIADRASRAVAAAGRTPDAINEWCQKNLGARLRDDQLEAAETEPQAVVEEVLREMMRAEVTQFERWVLLQIVDQAWKDHLYAVDRLRDSIGLRSFSQRDPKIEFKREGARLFEEMWSGIRDRVTDLIFKAKLSPQAAPSPQQRQQAAAAAPGRQESPAGSEPRPPAPAQPATAAAAAAVAGTATQRRDLEAAERAGQPQEAAARPKRQPARAVATVGRNEPCPCGSGKKFKQCCGKKG